MGSKRRHHHVPKAILRFFRFNRTQLHYYSKASTVEGIVERNPDGVFWQPHLYSLELKDGTRSQEIEDIFASEVDNKLRPIVSKRMVLANTMLKDCVSATERKFLLEVCYNFFVRSPLVTKNLANSSHMKLAERLYSLADRLKPSSEFVVPSQLKQVVLLTRELNIAEEMFADFGFHYATPENPYREFVIGDLPLCRFEPSEQEWRASKFGMSKEKFEFVLVLSPKLVLVLSGTRSSDTTIKLPDDSVDKINGNIFNQCSEVAARKAEEIESLIC